MLVYKLTNDERQAFEILSTSCSNILMVVCDMGGDFGCVVIYADLIDSKYTDYRALLGETLDSNCIVEGSFECPT